MRIPLIVLTGFLGSGKTTLLRHVLTHSDARIAVIENELAELAIDDRLLHDAANAEIVTLTNGCVCCSAGADLLHALVQLHERLETGTVQFGRVIVETTGLAGVVSLARMLSGTQRVAERYRLDAIVAIVDARHGERQFDDFAEAREQVAIADRILISKTDLVSEPDEIRVRERIRDINPRAPIEPIRFGAIPAANLVDLRAFDRDVLELAAVEAHSVRDGHADCIDSFVFRASRPFDVVRLDRFLAAIVDLYAPNLLRYKGVLHLDGQPQQWIVQGVHSLACAEAGTPWPAGEIRRSALVFIGRDLPEQMLRDGLERCLVSEVPTRLRSIDPCLDRLPKRPSWLHTT